MLGTLPGLCPEPVPQVRALSLTCPVAAPIGFHDNPDPVMSPFVSQRANLSAGGSPSQLWRHLTLELLASQGLAP